MKPKRRVGRRTLTAELLERRNMLSAALACPKGMPPEPPAIQTSALVQNLALPVDGQAADSLLQPRTRSGGDNTTGDGVFQRPRDRDSQDATVATASLAAATTETTSPRTRAGEDNTTGSGVFQRPRDRDSQDATLVTSQVTTSQSAVLRSAGAAVQSRLVSSQLTVAEEEHLLYMREEEKLARDVYLTLAAKWNVPIFTNIAASEQQHMDALANMIGKYKLVDPVVDNTVGAFANPTFSALYEQLVQAGSASVVDAYKVGAMIEEMDIVDLRAALAVTTHTDIRSVYDNLTRGSRNHLRSFYAQIVSAGETYDAQYLPQEEFLAIATSPMETGGSQRGR